MRAGDHVYHSPTGETWVVAYDDGEKLAWCGWPEGEARTRDCTLVKAASDEEHLRWLKEIATADDERGRMARARLVTVTA